ncbi:MAG: hypothetical protein CMH90_00475 [Oceanicaulis sp.]|uniref:DUF418 domain-containing protein n=1 Tax=Oceanicaulis sp. UBA2681 TaxID=1947007 RepID=UPI000C0B9EB6|nr:DUF418 domain-containing protein [Oceanicaulis sp. UBA2681]MAP47933.1 hypothetical protein [Oceanicaulis sp.]HCR65373.1 hypothetical protein [Oceanicaulis sp.]
MSLHTAPVAAKDRFESLDVLRGVAVLGILMMNVQAFTMASNAYAYPPAHMDLTGANLTVWYISHVFFEMKFITIFSALFGAGMLLMVGEEPDAPRKLHFSRMTWLLVIGLIHMFGLWFGDILVTYAIGGFIIVFFRRMSPGKLIGWGLFWVALSGLLMVAIFASFTLLPADMGPTDVGIAYSDEQLAELVNTYQSGYLPSRIPNALNGLGNILMFAFFGGRIVGVMLLGMALYKLGFLLGRWSVRHYVIAAAVGLGVGLPIVAWGGQVAIDHDFSLDTMWIHTATNYGGSLLVSLGYAALINLACKAPWLKLIRAPFAAAGRMAFTNYLTQSIVMVFLTVGGIGLGLFGELERIQQAQLVVVIWAVQLIVSVLWLQVFRFGPFEWLWRSLSYGQLQPIMKVKA